MIIGKLHIFSRNLVTSSICRQVKPASLGNQVKMMKKVMAGREKGKRRWTYHEGMTKLETATQISDPKGQRKPYVKRVAVLNKLFMKNVSDMLATDAFAKDILGYGLQITNVKMAPDFKSVNIFWLAGSDENDTVVQSILNTISGPLRHELSILRIMGEVPKIYFVRDRNFSKAAEIDSILKTCDFGDDFVPTDPTFLMTSTPEVEMKLPDEIRRKIFEVEKEHEHELEVDIEIPPMTHNILGLDRDRIMRKITASMEKSRQAWEEFERKKLNPAPATLADSSDAKEKAIRISIDLEKLKLEAQSRNDFMKSLERRLYSKATPERKKHHMLCPEDDTNEASENYSYEYYYEDDDIVELEDNSMKKT